MGDEQHPSHVPPFRKGEHLTAARLNALRGAVMHHHPQPNSYTDSSGSVVRQPPVRRRVASADGPLIVQGLVDADFETTDATVILKSVQAFDGRDISDHLDESDKLTVQNTFKWQGDTDGIAMAIYWTAGTAQWRLFQVECPGEEEEEEEE